MSVSAQDLASKFTGQTSFPDVAFRINDALEDLDSSASDIGKIIELDPALSVALLRMANSAFYGRSGSVGTIEQAVMLVGLKEIRDLAFGVCAATTFNNIPNELISVEDFWKHSLYCASAAQKLGQKSKVRIADSLFTAGLLHDIGHLVMFNQIPDLSRQALSLSLDENDGLLPYLSERQVMGFDHMEVGAELARQWNLPPGLQACIGFHHEPFKSEIATDAVVAVHVANSVAVLAELGSTNLDDAPPIDDRALDHLGLDVTILGEIAEETSESVIELLRIFVN